MRFHTASGQVADLLAANEAQLRVLRWSQISVVMQSAMNALNPVFTIGAQLTDVLEAHLPRMSKQAQRDRAAELLAMVGITADRLGSYPHELSGGMRQRVMIAMALALEPDVVIMDEPTTALDVVTQREILEELAELRERLGFAVLFITHDLSLLIEIADSIAVMYAGRLVERATAAALFRAPRHPYSLGLLSSFPSLHGPRQHLTGIPGSPPDLRDLPAGLRVPPPLPVRDGPVPDRQPAAGRAGRGRPAAAGGLLAARRPAGAARAAGPALAGHRDGRGRRARWRRPEARGRPRPRAPARRPGQQGLTRRRGRASQGLAAVASHTEAGHAEATHRRTAVTDQAGAAASLRSTP